MSGRLPLVWTGFRPQQGFSGHDRVFMVMCYDRGPLCLVMACRLD